MRIVAYDMEMLCWEDKPDTGDIIEIAAVIVDLRTGKITKRYSIVVKPDNGTVSDFCTSLTGITQRIVDKQGVTLEEAMRRLHKQVSQKLDWYAWGKDAQKLLVECGKRGIDIDPSSLHNIAPFVRMMYLQNRNLGQGDVCNNLGVEVFEPKHRALPDAESLAGLIVKLFAKNPMFTI